MSEETTSEQLAEIEGQGESTPVTGYTPPEGWRVLAVGEVLQAGDMWVWPTDDQLRQTLHVGAVVGANQRYIRRIEPQPEPVQVPDAELRIRLLKECNARQAELIAALKYERSGAMERAEVLSREKRKLTEQIEELRSEVSYAQRLLVESRQRVTQLEELVTSLRTINEGAEKAVSGAGVVNDSLRLQLAAVKAELASVAADRQRLQIELDAAQQVPADSPELRQLRADLAEVAHDRDTYKHAHELLVQDIDATHQRTKAMTVEAIAEWLEPIRLADSAYLANATMRHLPSIMRHLTGLDSHAID